MSVVAPSDCGGAIASEAAVDGEASPAREVPAAAAEGVNAETMGDESDPGTSSDPLLVVGAVEIVVGAAGAVALTSNDGATAGFDATVAVVVVTTVVGCATVCAVVSVVVVVETIVF